MKKTSKKLASMRLEKNKTGSYARHWILPVQWQVTSGFEGVSMYHFIVIRFKALYSSSWGVIVLPVLFLTCLLVKLHISLFNRLTTHIAGRIG